MSKKKKTGFPKGLWVVKYVDQFDRDGGHSSEPLSKEEAEAKFNQLTENGTKNVSPKEGMGYYELRPYA